MRNHFYADDFRPEKLVHLNENRTEKWTIMKNCFCKRDTSLIFFSQDFLTGDPAHAGAEPDTSRVSGNTAGILG